MADGKDNMKASPCGGCGAETSSQRCIWCLHDFGTPDSAWVHKYYPASPITERGEGA
jgi:hypothetical protein